MEKGYCLQKTVLGKLNIHMQRNEIGFLSHNRHTKTIQKCINDLNVTLKTIKILKECFQRKLLDSGLKTDFLNLTPMHRQQHRKQTNVTLSN